jgi:hypothetical protein
MREMLNQCKFLLLSNKHYDETNYKIVMGYLIKIYDGSACMVTIALG